MSKDRVVMPLLRRLEEDKAVDNHEGFVKGEIREDVDEFISKLNSPGTGPLGNLAYADLSPKQMESDRALGEEVVKKEEKIKQEMIGIILGASSLKDLIGKLEEDFLFKFGHCLWRHRGDPKRQLEIVENTIISPISKNTALLPWLDEILRSILDTDLLKKLRLSVEK